MMRPRDGVLGGGAGDEADDEEDPDPAYDEDLDIRHLQVVVDIPSRSKPQSFCISSSTGVDKTTAPIQRFGCPRAIRTSERLIEACGVQKMIYNLAMSPSRRRFQWPRRVHLASRRPPSHRIPVR